MLCYESSDNTVDLTKNSATILAPFAAGTHTVYYYTSLDEANNDDVKTHAKSIQNPEAFQYTENPQTIYARVDNLETKCIQVLDFKVGKYLAPIEFGFQNGCSINDYILSAVPVNNSYNPEGVAYEWTEENGTDVLS